jgi:hypothetical protein
VQVGVGDEGPVVPDGATRLGATTLAIPMLDRPLDHATPIEDDALAGCARQGAPRWAEPTFTITVSLVSR